MALCAVLVVTAFPVITPISRVSAAAGQTCIKAYRQRVAEAHRLHDGKNGGLLYEATMLDAKVRLDLCRKGVPVRYDGSRTPPAAPGTSEDSIAGAPNSFPAACQGELLNTRNCTVVYCRFLEKSGLPGWTTKDTRECIEKITAQKEGRRASGGAGGGMPNGRDTAPRAPVANPPLESCDGPVRFGPCAQDRSGAVHWGTRQVGPDGRISPYDETPQADPYGGNDDTIGDPYAETAKVGSVPTAPAGSDAGHQPNALERRNEPARTDAGIPARPALRDSASQPARDGPDGGRQEPLPAPIGEVSDELATAIAACDPAYATYVEQALVGVDQRLADLARRRQALDALGHKIGRPAIDDATKAAAHAGAAIYLFVKRKFFDVADHAMGLGEAIGAYEEKVRKLHAVTFAKMDIDDEIAGLQAKRTIYLEEIAWNRSSKDCRR
ncbi:MAG: hypothetical protein D6757_06675 [Alphaproteobacteria bacterium]|nr:MAG: hypothetical protein D6757_06675 [Alphaproteobacteria bacterium]